MIILLCLVLVRLLLEYCVSFGTPAQEGHWHTAASPTEATLSKRRARALDNQGRVERAGFLHHHRRRLGGDSIPVFGYITGIHRGNWVRLPSEVHSDSLRGNGRKLQHEKFQLDIRGKKFITGELNTGSPRNGGISILRDIQHLSGYKALRHLIKWPCFDWGDWTGWPPEVPFDLSWSMTFSKNHGLHHPAFRPDAYLCFETRISIVLSSSKWSTRKATSWEYGKPGLSFFPCFVAWEAHASMRLSPDSGRPGIPLVCLQSFFHHNCRNQKSVTQMNADRLMQAERILKTPQYCRQVRPCLTACGPASSDGTRQYGRSWAYSSHQMTTEFAFLFWICGTAARIPPVYLLDLSQHGPSWRFEKPYQRMPFFLTTACGFLSVTFLGK